MPQYDYNFDPHAALPENLILGEEHKITKAGRTRVIVPNFAPFFFKDHILRLGSEVLIEGIDYYLCIQYRGATHRFGQLVYGGFWLIDDNRVGTFRIDYRTVGAQYVQTRSVVNAYLTNELTDPQLADWIDVVGTPLFIPPVEIKFDRPAFIDEQALSAGIRTLGDVIATKDPKEDELYQFLDNWLRELERIVHAEGVSAHITDYNNPHGTQWYHADALKVDGTATNANKAYGRTLAQLTEYVNARGITQAHLDKYIKLRGGNLVTGNLTLRDGAMLIEGVGSGTGSLLGMEFGNATIDTVKGVTLASDRNNAGNRKSTLQAGTNTLEVVSSGGVQDKNNLLLNGQPVVHAGNLTDHLPTVGSNTVSLITQNTLNLTFTGKGTTNSPLSVSVVIPDASTAASGLGKITDDLSTSTSLAISEYVVGEVNKLMAGKVLTTRKVQGRPLTRNINITKTDLRLQNKVNLPDKDLPIGSKHVSLVSNLSPNDHKHTVDDFNIPTATTTRYGLAKVTTSLTPPSTTDVLSASVVRDLNFKATTSIDEVVNRVPKDMLDISVYGGYSNTPIAVNATGWKVTFTQSQLYYTGGVQYTLPITVLDLAVLYPTTRYNTRFYLYVLVEGKSASYILRTSRVVDTATTIMIGSVYTHSSGISKVEVERKFRLGRFREMIDHINASKAHGYDWDNVTAATLGLGSVENKPLLENLVIPSFKDVFNTWYRFSHRSDGVYPSIPAETETWQYLPDTDSIRNLTNSSSLVGLVSNDVVGDYEFITGVSSTDRGDDDFIGVVLAFVIVDGVEHTLTALASGTDTRKTTFTIAHNFLQGSVKTIWSKSQPWVKRWRDMGECVISATRRGSTMTVEFSAFTGIPESEGGSHTFELTGDLAVFRNATRFGYAAWSQPHSTWRSIKRPDEDASSYYGSAELLSKHASWSEMITYQSGVVSLSAGKGTIPLPRSVDPNSYHVWLGIKNVSNFAGGYGGGETSYVKTNTKVDVDASSGWATNTELNYVITIYNDIRLYTNN